MASHSGPEPRRQRPLLLTVILLLLACTSSALLGLGLVFHIGALLYAGLVVTALFMLVAVTAAGDIR